jgi:hypothetical protein
MIRLALALPVLVAADTLRIAHDITLTIGSRIAGRRTS